LHRAVGEAPDRTGNDVAVGVEDDQHVGRARSQMRDPRVERQPLAPMRRVDPFEHLGPPCAGDGRRVVGAVVGDDEDAVSGPELGQDTSKRPVQHLRFVVGRDEHDDRLRGPARLR
jgi:hypothetical protein